MLSANLATRPDFGSRPSQQQSVLRAYAGNREAANEEIQRSTDSRQGSARERSRAEAAQDPDSVLSYRKSGGSLRLLIAGDVLGRSLDIHV